MGLTNAKYLLYHIILNHKANLNKVQGNYNKKHKTKYKQTKFAHHEVCKSFAGKGSFPNMCFFLLAYNEYSLCTGLLLFIFSVSISSPSSAKTKILSTAELETEHSFKSLAA